MQQLVRIGVQRRAAKNEVIFLEGQQSDGFHVVLEGEVKIFRMSSQGREKILHLFEPGQPIGEVAVFSGRRFPASAQANTDSRLLFFPGSAFVELVFEDPGK